MQTDMRYVQTELPIRIQFSDYFTLRAECIVQGTDEAERVYAAYVNLKHARNQSMGGVIFYRSDLKRHWDIPVGATIPQL